MARARRRDTGRFADLRLPVVSVGLAAALVAGCGGGGGGGGGGGTPTPAPRLALSTTTLQFSDPYVGGTYAKQLGVRNTGTAALRVTALTVDAAGTAAGYGVTDPAVPFNVDPAGLQTVTVTLRRTGAAGSGALHLASNDATTPDALVALVTTTSGTPAVATCVLQGAKVSDGCAVDGGGAPVLDYGTVARGATVSRVVALSNSGTGSVALEITGVDPDPATSPYAVSLFRLAGATEVPVTLPYDLTAYDPSGVTTPNELRVRVTLTAPEVEGAVSGTALRVAAAASAGQVSVPITALVSGCPAGTADCDGIVSNGCETAIATDLANCGACGAVCGTQNSSSTCTAGVCGISCAAGWGNCDGSAANGCETNLQTDTAHCGACTTACSTTNDTPTCGAGTCVLTCAAGYGDCDHDVTNGCETSTLTDPANCGACGTVCPDVPHATKTCAAGTCGYTCLPGWVDCNGIAADGCEIDTAADPSNCGGCGVACSTNHVSTPLCAAGVCSGACDAGYADCNGNKQTDGCEIATQTDPANCGGCGQVCSSNNGTPSCAAGTCGITCNGGYASCDGTLTNGCETSTATNPDDCGGCGQVCSSNHMATRTCGSGVCDGACAAGYADCNGNKLTDGCETNLTTDVGNCGACGNACALTANVSSVACAASTCQVTGCAVGYYNMDGAYADGCECAADAAAKVCASAATTALGGPGTSATITGSVVPVGDEDWYQVTFAGVQACGYHPNIVLQDLGSSGVIRMDINTSSCGTVGGCGIEGTSSLGLTQWETFASGACGYYGSPDPYRYGQAYVTTALVRVYAIASSATCLPYQLAISN